MNINDITNSLDEQNQQQQQQQDKQGQLDAVSEGADKISKTIQDTAKQTQKVDGSVKVTNPDLAKSQDVAGVVESINKLNLTTFMQNDGLPKLAQNLSDLSAKTEALQEKMETEGLKRMSDQLGVVVSKLDGVAKILSKTEVSVDTKLQKTIDNLSNSIGAIDFNPSVNVSAPQTKVVTTPVDLSSLLKALGSVETAIKETEAPDTQVDLGPVTSGLSEVVRTIGSLKFPSANYVLPFKDQTGKAIQVKLNDDGSLPITASISTGALATSANQTNASQKTQVVDGSGNIIGATSNALDVNIKSGSSAGVQYTEDAAAAADPVGTAVNLVRKDTPAATVSADGDNIAQRGTNFGAAYVTLLDSSGGTVAVGGGTQYVEDAASAGGEQLTLAGTVRQDTPAGSTSADGDYANLKTDSIGRLWVNASGAAVPVTDNSGSLTVDNGGTFAVQATIAAGATNIAKAEDVASADADVGVPALAVRKAVPANTSGTDGDYEFLQMSAGRLWVDASGKTLTVDGSGVTQPVSGSVTANAGTNLNTSALALESGGNLATVAGAVISQEAITSGVKGVTAFGAVTTNAPSYTTAKSDALSLDTSGLLRVSLKDTPANTNKFLVTPDSVALPANQSVNVSQINAVTPLMGNGTTGTGSQRVTIASDNTAFSVNATLSAETTKVIGVVRNADGSGNLLVSATNALNSTGAGVLAAQVVGQFDDTSPTAITENQFGNLRMSANRNLYGTIRDAAGNERGVNVTAGNALTVDGSASTQPVSYATTGSGTATGALRVELPTNGTGVVGLNTGTNSIGDVRSITTSVTPGTGATNLGKAEDAVHSSGDVGVAILGIRDDTLNATSGSEGDYEMIHTTAEGAVWVTQAPSITNGWATFNATSGDGSTALTSTAQQVKGTVGTVGGWYIYNPNASATYVNFYNATSASVTVGTTNQQMVICVPPTAGANVEFGNGITFSTAISISATTTGGGNSAPATALECNVFYK